MLDISAEIKKADDEPCRGLVYKAEVTQYLTQKGIAQTIRLVEQKRLSCRGCEHCAWLYDSLQESLRDAAVDFDRVQHGKYYTLAAVNIKRDWESGFIDAWDIGLEEYVP